jgi:hypothetical protein
VAFNGHIGLGGRGDILCDVCLERVYDGRSGIVGDGDLVCLVR